MRGDAISCLRKTCPRKFPSTKANPMTETEVKSIIRSFKAKQSKAKKKKKKSCHEFMME
jgi:hypothetical protein